jgi:hypothetical protein
MAFLHNTQEVFDRQHHGKKKNDKKTNNNLK